MGRSTMMEVPEGEVLASWPEDVAALPPGRYFVRVPVARLLSDHDLSLVAHLVVGAERGPVLGLLAGIHGDETPGVRIIRETLARIRPDALAGAVVAVPVANPLAWHGQVRATPELDVDHANLARVFHSGESAPPAFDSLARRIAATLEHSFFAAITHLIDFHCYGRDTAVRVMLYRTSQDAEMAAASAAMAHRFGLGVVYGVGGGQGTTSAYAAKRRIPACVPEFGATRCARQAEDAFVQEGSAGTLRVMAHLGMVAGSAVPSSAPAEQLVVERTVAIFPQHSGYWLPTFDLEELYQPEHRCGIAVEPGQTLGEVFDTYTLRQVETVVAPQAGRLIALMRTGPYSVGSRSLTLAIGALQG